MNICISIYLGIFICTWTPYALVSLYSAFVDSDGVSPMGATLPAVIAKSASIWSTIFFLLSNRNIKSRAKAELNISDTNPTDSNVLTGIIFILKKKF